MDISDQKLPAPTMRVSQDGRLSEGKSGPEDHAWYLPGRSGFPLCIVDAGNSTWSAGHYFHRRKSDTFAVEMVVSGSMRFVQNRREYLVKPGQVFLLHLNGDHMYTTGPAGFVHKRFANIIGSALDGIVTGSGLGRVDVVEVGDPRAVASCIRSAIRLLRSKPAGFEKTLSALAYELLNELVASSHARRSPPVQAALDYVHQHVSEPVTNDDLAGVAGVSQSYLIRSFTKEVGATPHQYHSRNRMQLAWNLLRRGEIPVKEVAERVGFDDPLYFSKVFRKTYGLSPRGMRRP